MQMKTSRIIMKTRMRYANLKMSALILSQFFKKTNFYVISQ